MADQVLALLGNEAVSAQEAAQKLSDPSRTTFAKYGDLTRFEEELYVLWCNILSAAEKTPHDQQDKLVDVMRVIKNMPEPVHDGKKMVIWSKEWRWDELPMFAAFAREQLDGAQSRSGQAFVNINAFFARLTAAEIQDFLLFAIWAFRQTLEDPAEDEVALKDSPELLKSAAVWFIYAAESLAKARDEGEQFEGNIGRPGDSLSAFRDVPGWRGFCPDRWNVWKTRLASLGGTGSLKDAQDLIHQALERMGRV